MSCVKQRSPFSTVGVYTVCVCVCLCMRSYFVSPCKCMVIRFIFIFIFKDSGEQTSGGWHAENSPVQTQASQASAMFQHMDHLLNQVSYNGNTGEVLLLNNYRNLYFL